MSNRTDDPADGILPIVDIFGARRVESRAVGHGSRSLMTCRYRCGRACDHPVPNQSDNPYFGHLLTLSLTGDDVALSRRNLVRAGAFGALVLTVGGVAAPAAAGEIAHRGEGRGRPHQRPAPARGHHLAHLLDRPAEPAGRHRRAERLRPFRGDPLG